MAGRARSGSNADGFGVGRSAPHPVLTGGIRSRSLQDSTHAVHAGDHGRAFAIEPGAACGVHEGGAGRGDRGPGTTGSASRCIGHPARSSRCSRRSIWPKRLSQQRIDPLIEESPELRELVMPSRSRDSGNTILGKRFPGGQLVLTGANSAVGLRSMPARWVFLDEVDAYPGDLDGEGDPIALAEARTISFWPQEQGVSRLDAHDQGLV